MKKGQRLYPHTEEHKRWLIENSNGRTIVEILPEFNERFGRNDSFFSLTKYMSRQGIPYSKMHMVSDSEFEKVREWLDGGMTVEEAIDSYEKNFGYRFVRMNFIHMLNRHGYRIRFLLDEQVEWVKENASKFCAEELTRRFNEKYGENRTVYTMWSICRHRGIYIGSPEIKAKAIQDSKTKYQVGEISVQGGIQHVKVMKRGYKEALKDTFMMRSRYEYEKMHGVKLCKDDVIAFLDGDKNNFSKDNMIKVSRGTNRKVINSGGYEARPTEVTKTRVMIYELEDALRKLK